MKKIELEDFKLTPDEIKILVTGAQTFLPPIPDESDEDQLTPEPKKEP